MCIRCGTSRLMLPVHPHPSLNINARAASASVLCHGPSSPISPRFALYGGLHSQVMQHNLPFPPYPHQHPHPPPQLHPLSTQPSQSPYIPSQNSQQQHARTPSLQSQMPMTPTGTSRTLPLQLQQPQQPLQRLQLRQLQPPPSPIRPARSSYPLLTPSGRALSVGGRVRNISEDPMFPCIMYWPDNEPFPEHGQIRPIGSTVSVSPVFCFIAITFLLF